MRARVLNGLVNAIAGSPLIPRKARWLLLRAYGLRLESWRIGCRCFFGGKTVAIGPHSYVNNGCYFDTLAPITIGADCAIGMGVMFVTSTHVLATNEHRAGRLKPGPIVVEDGCWLGARATILPGARIARGSVIAAGAVVHAAPEPDTLYAGIPARPQRHFAR